MGHPTKSKNAALREAKQSVLSQKARLKHDEKRRKLRFIPKRDRGIAVLIQPLHAHTAEHGVPKQSLYGILANAGEAPSADVIDEARREMWSRLQDG